MPLRLTVGEHNTSGGGVGVTGVHEAVVIEKQIVLKTNPGFLVGVLQIYIQIL